MIKKLILASGSPYRQVQIQQLGLDVTCLPVDIDESIHTGEAAKDAAIRLSIAKASAVTEPGPALVIGSDQTASLGVRILGKPGTTDKAVEQVSACSGQQVTFYSGICVLDGETGALQTECVITKVIFRELTNTQICNYVDRERPLDCAGSFKCEGLGIALFESITSSDPTALIGLPLIALNKMLLHFGVDALDP